MRFSVVWYHIYFICYLTSVFAFDARRNHSFIRNRYLQMEIFEGNPIGRKIWDAAWKLPVLQPSKQGTSPTKFGDAAQILKSNILQVYGDEPSEDGAPIAEGEIDGLLEGSLFLGLQKYFLKVMKYLFRFADLTTLSSAYELLLSRSLHSFLYDL